MRCDNCGWCNADGATRCIKCNQPLRVEEPPVRESSSIVVGSSEDTMPEQEPVKPLCKQTVRIDAESFTQHQVSLSHVPDSRKLKTTVVDAEAFVADYENNASKSTNLVQTVADTAAFTASDAKEDSAVTSVQVNNIGQGNIYVFRCLDSIETGKIEIHSDKELSFSQSEIILLSGLRFQKEEFQKQ